MCDGDRALTYSKKLHKVLENTTNYKSTNSKAKENYFSVLIIFCVCVSVLPSIPNCEAGHVLPVFLSTTPSHGDVLYATVGQEFQLFAEAQAHHARYFLLKCVTHATNFAKERPGNKDTRVTKHHFSVAKKNIITLCMPNKHNFLMFLPFCFLFPEAYTTSRSAAPRT